MYLSYMIYKVLALAILFKITMRSAGTHIWFSKGVKRSIYRHMAEALIACDWYRD